VATHIALLRGINVGKAKRVAMADLRDIVAGLGYGDVKTLLNSGNVVFSAPGVKAPEAAQRIEKRLAAKLRIESRVTVLTAKEMRAVIDDNPFADVVTEPSRFLVAVPSTKSDLEKLRPHVARDWSPEYFALGSRVAYMWCPGGVLESGVNDVVGRALRDAVTVRNWATMSKIYAVCFQQ
jgi:uncharacterized protein (DUF1697 family)